MDTDPALIAAARLLLSRLTQAETKGPAMSEIWESYYACDGKRLKSARHADLAWRMVDSVVGKDGKRLGEREAMGLTSEVVEEIRDGLAKSPFTGRVLRPGTRNRNLYIIHRVLAWAARNRRIPYVPICPPKDEPTPDAKKSRIRTDEEFARLLACIKHPVLRVFVLVLFDSGMRFGEAIQIRRVQFARRPGKGGVVDLTGDQTKTGKPRRVYLTRRACDAIQSLPNRGPYIFASPRGGHYSYPFFYHLLIEAVDKSGLEAAPGETLRFHSCRHSFVARARFLFRWPQTKIMAQTGHTSDAIYRMYGREDADEMEQSIDDVDAKLPRSIF
jgi:integrase